MASRWRGWLRRIGFGALVLVVLYAIAYFWVGSVADARLDAELAAIRERGEPLLLEEMAPPPVPDAENAAVPFAEAVEALSHESNDEWEALPRFIDAPVEADDETVALTRAWVGRNATALEGLEEALRLPSCRFELDYTKSVDMDLPHVPKLIDFGQLLQARALLRARDGDFEGAYDDCRRLFRLGGLGAADPILISLMVRITAEQMSLRALEHLLGREQPSPETRAALDAAIAGRRLREELHRTLFGERCFGASAYRAVRDDPRVADMTIAHGGASGLLLSLGVLPDPVLRLDEARYLRFMSDAIALVGPPWHEAAAGWSGLEAEYRHAPWYAEFSGTLLGFLPRIVKETEKHRAWLDMARIALAESAGEARPDLTDPFTGKPYEVAVADDGSLTIRSPGPDPDDASDDVLWPHPPEE